MGRGRHTGLFAATVYSDGHLKQDFAAVPVAQLVAADFWSWHDGADAPTLKVEWTYSDNTTGNVVYDAGLNGWKQHDILAKLAPGKSLKSLRVYAYANDVGPPDQVSFDDFHLCRKP